MFNTMERLGRNGVYWKLGTWADNSDLKEHTIRFIYLSFVHSVWIKFMWFNIKRGLTMDPAMNW